MLHPGAYPPEALVGFPEEHHCKDETSKSFNYSIHDCTIYNNSTKELSTLLTNVTIKAVTYKRHVTH